MIVVDPRFTRTASQADLFLQIRAGADIAFLGGVINYAIQNNRIAKDYLINYTNAAFIVKDGFKLPDDGLFSGLTPPVQPTIKRPGTIKKAEGSKRPSRSLERRRKPAHSLVKRILKRPQGTTTPERTQKRAAMVEVTRLREDQARQARVGKNLYRCYRQTSLTIFRCSTRAVSFNF